MNHEDYLRLCQEIWEHNKRYYIDHAPIISDEEFDRLLRSLEEVEREHPEWVTPTSPTQRVGEMLTEGFQTVVHRTPMLSLANTYSTEEIDDFIARMHKLVGREDLAFICELKMDGIAVSVRYEKGCFGQAVTRGDGKQGDDITNNMKTIASLPLQIYGRDIPEVLEVRGEVFMPVEAFQKFNDQREKAGEVLLANPRNAAAGALKLLDPKETAKRELAVVFYAVAEVSPGQLRSQYAVHEHLHRWGLPTLQYAEKCRTLQEIWAFAEKIKQVRPLLPYHIDGMVIKLDDLHEGARLGNTGKSPRAAVAYKFAAEQAATRIRDIIVQVGRTGVCTPVAELEPVLLAGSTIARATLHNEEEVRRKDIRVGDLATIEKGGDVIPKVVAVDLASRPLDSHPWQMPAHCPSCNTLLVRTPGEVAVRCSNAKQCPEQQLRRVVYFASKEAMGIENLGEKVVEQLMARRFVTKPSDIYKLTEMHLYQLDGFKTRAVQRLLESIDQSRNVPLPRFIMALGIKHVGAGTADLLARKAGNVETLAGMTKVELISIEGIGEKVAGAVVEFFQDEANMEEIHTLLACGVKPQKVEVVNYSGHSFHDKTFVLTGTLEKYTRAGAGSLIKERGGKLVGSVSGKTDFLLAGAAAGSKLAKAKALGVRVLDEAEFDAML